MTEFSYVDMTYKGSSDWKRIRIDEVEEKFLKSAGVNFYVSLQQFKSPIPAKADEEELYISDFIIDVDVKGRLERAFEATKEIREYFWEKLNILPPYPRIWFSGQKGFHIVIHKDILGIKPHTHLHEMFRLATTQLSGVLKLKEIDTKIYTKRRVMRYPNSIHDVTRLHKIELTHEDIDTLTVKDILEMAKKPREPLKFRFEPVDRCETASKWWSSITENWNNNIQHRELKPRAKLKVIKGEYPRCMQYLLNNRAPDGSRNKTSYVIASFLLNQGVKEKDAIALLKDWVNNHYSADVGRLQERLTNTESVVKTVYQSGYFFSCSICQSIDSSVNYCEGLSKCKFVTDPKDQETAEIPVVDLGRASQNIYFDKVIKIPVYIVGKYEQPYEIPNKVIANCKSCPDKPDGICAECPLYGGRDAEFVASIKTKGIMKLLDTTDEKVMQHLRGMMRLPKCENVNLMIVSKGNMQVLIMNPMVDYIEDMKMAYHDESNLRSGKADFVTRQGFFLGHDVDINAKYYATCTSCGHPMTQQVVHLIDHLEPASSTLDNFNPKPHMLQSLEIFQQGDLQSVLDKFNEIHEDFECNVHKIIKRRVLAFAIDLVYHSALSYYMGDEFDQRGWIELCVIGDSAQGKTHIAQKLNEHFQVGGWTSAEGEGRTGLGFTKQQITSSSKGGAQWMVRWGLLPQNDRGLLNIDEFSGMKLEDFEQLTDARDKGIMRANGATAGYITRCRTRQIYLSNARDRYRKPGSGGAEGGSLGQYAYGIEAVAGLYGAHQDLRRVDFAVAVKKGDVSVVELNSMMKKKAPHKYTTELCKNLILWTWSRTAAQIIIADDVIQDILDAAIRISNKYATSKMNLVDPSTQKKKVARMAIAVAARLFSTDDTYTYIIVKKEHVEFAEQVFYMSYDSPGMQYDIYAAHNRDIQNISEQERDEIVNILTMATGGTLNMKMLLKTIIDAVNVHAGILQSCGMTQDQARNIVIMLRERNLLDGNDVKTSTGMDLFKNLFHRYA